MARYQNPLLNAGSKLERIPVTLSYHIIEHFSAGLYSSPYKAIEELVANSYDAFARNVHIITPDNPKSQNATLWVIDDGESMDVEGFRQLWKIGESRKRDPGLESTERPPIGRFGIGKLATYVLANEVTHICKKDRKYRAISMNYAKVRDTDSPKQLRLDVRELSLAEAKELLKTLTSRKDEGSKTIPLFGKGSPKSWTVTALSNFKEMAQRLQKGRLDWILSTALPMNPEFNLFRDGSKVTSKLHSGEVLKEWTIGDNDSTADRQDLEQGVDGKGVRVVRIPGLGSIHGTVQLFGDKLTETGRKFERWGRSCIFRGKTPGDSERRRPPIPT